MRKTFLVLAALLISCWPGLSQANVAMSPTLSVSVGRNPALSQGFGLDNVWVVTARHCQDYAKRKGHLWWKHWIIDEAACNADPSTVYQTFQGHNLVTNAGFDMAAKSLSDTAAQPASCNYFAFAIDSSNAGVGTVAITDTALNSSGTGSTEIATSGGSRNLSPRETFAHTNGTLSYTLTKSFSITGTLTGINKFAVFNATSAGTMCFELLFTPVTVNNLDTLTPTLTNTMSNP